MNKIKLKRKAVVITGEAVEKLLQLKKDYMREKNKTISFDDIVSKALLNAKFEDILSI